MPDQPLDMWSYWRDRKGAVEALQDYYPDLLKQRPDLMHGLLQIQSGELLINETMEGLAE